MEVLHFTGLYEKRHVISKDMGTPDQKRLEMARALATKPEVLFLDENMAGLNPAESEEAIQLIRKIKAAQYVRNHPGDGLGINGAQVVVSEDVAKPGDFAPRNVRGSQIHRLAQHVFAHVAV